jgi:hypothetical protein
VALVAAAWAAALSTAACSGTTPHPLDKDAGDAGGPDTPETIDGANGDGGGGLTLWLAPNGSEVVLKLDTSQPTVPF